MEDTGVGIGEEDLPRLGEAFFQARASYDRRHDGSGLGLSIVKGLLSVCMAAMSIFAAVSARERASPCACLSIAKAAARP